MAGDTERPSRSAGREQGMRERDAAVRRREGDLPDSPTDLGKRSWWGVLKRSISGFRKDNLTDWAAALTYYGILSIFPALVALVAVLGLLGRDTIQPLLTNVGAFAPGPTRDIITTALENLESNQSAAGLTFIVSLAIALWSASGYVAAFMRASNAVYEMPEGRPIWKTIPTRLAITVVLVILLAASALVVVFTGDLASWAGQLIGLGDTAVAVWDIAKWPVLVLIVALILAILYWGAPNVKQPRFRWLTPGSILAVLLWIVASAAFGFYIANFGNYNRTYGAMAGVIIFLIWLWVSNIAVMLGLEVDAELLRGRAIEGGHPPDVEPFVEPRDTRKFDDADRSPRDL
ncbi:MAG TPA: YihY/virulence factor BrkB family protein [Jiangellaceae bacterium]